MKLIEVIPKKSIRIHGNYYEVYEPVYYQDNILAASLHGKCYRLYIRSYKAIKDHDERHKLFRDGIRKKVNQMNLQVEKDYLGDKYRKASEDIRATVTKSARGTFSITYLAHCTETFRSKHYSVYIGKASEVTETQIRNAEIKAGYDRLEKNKHYNRVLTEKRQKFREIVNQQVIDRDTDILEDLFIEKLTKKA